MRRPRPGPGQGRHLRGRRGLRSAGDAARRRARPCRTGWTSWPARTACSVTGQLSVRVDDLTQIAAAMARLAPRTAGHPARRPGHRGDRPAAAAPTALRLRTARVRVVDPAVRHRTETQVLPAADRRRSPDGRPADLRPPPRRHADSSEIWRRLADRKIAAPHRTLLSRLPDRRRRPVRSISRGDDQPSAMPRSPRRRRRRRPRSDRRRTAGPWCRPST